MGNSSERIINTGLCAYGMSGQVFHGPLLASDPRYRVVKVLERSGSRSAGLFPDASIVRSLSDLIYDKDIELIIVNTPDHTHYNFARQALNARKHVVVEKPFTVTVSEAKRLVRLAHRKGRLLTVFQNRRWDGDFLTVRKLVEQKKLGRVVEFESHFDRYRNYIQTDTWKEDGKLGTGTLYNLGSHLVDQVLVLFGMPDSLYAEIKIQRDGGKVNDYYDIHMYYEGLKVILKSSYLVREPGPRFMVHGTQGGFLKYGTDPQEEALKAGKLPSADPRWGREDKEWWGLLNTEVEGRSFQGALETEAGCYPAFYDNLYMALTGGTEPAVTPYEAVNTIYIIEKAIESSRKKHPVKIM